MARRIEGLGWRRQLPDPRDKAFAYRPTQLPSYYPPRFFLPYSSPIRDQGAEGSCTGHGMYRIMSNLRLAQGLPFVDLSPRDPYYRARVIEGTPTQDSGAEIRDALKGVARNGICTEAAWPYVAGQYHQPPPAAVSASENDNMLEGYQPLLGTGLDRLAAIKDALAGYKRSIIFGITLFKEFDSDAVANSGLVPMPDLGIGSVIGGHCMVLEGYDDHFQAPGWEKPGGFFDANSWWTTWGCEHPELNQAGRGYCWLSYDYVCDGDLASDFWIGRRVAAIQP